MNRQDEKIVAAANTWLKSLGDFSQWYKDSCNAPTITSLLNIIDRLDKQSSAMLAPLERWKESRERNAHPDSPSMKRLMKETEALLEEAKEVKYGN